MENAFENVLWGDDGGTIITTTTMTTTPTVTMVTIMTRTSHRCLPNYLITWLANFAGEHLADLCCTSLEMSSVFDLSRAHPRTSFVDVISRLMSSRTAAYPNSVLLTLSRIMPHNQGKSSLPTYAYLHFFIKNSFGKVNLLNFSS